MTEGIDAKLDSILAEVRHTNGRVKELEAWRSAADTRLGKVEDVIAAAPETIKTAVQSVFDERETAAKVAKMEALEKRFGPDIEDNLARWSAIKRLFTTTASKAWLTVATLAAGAGAAAILERLF